MLDMFKASMFITNGKGFFREKKTNVLSKIKSTQVFVMVRKGYILNFYLSTTCLSCMTLHN